MSMLVLLDFKQVAYIQFTKTINLFNRNWNSNYWLIPIVIHKEEKSIEILSYIVNIHEYTIMEFPLFVYLFEVVGDVINKNLINCAIVHVTTAVNAIITKERKSNCKNTRPT